MFFPAPTGGDVKVGQDSGELVVLKRPDWFEREDFQLWRQGKFGDGPAAWGAHYSCDGDVFMTFYRDPSVAGDYWDGSDVDAAMPAYVYADVGRTLREYGCREGVIWLCSS